MLRNAVLACLSVVVLVSGAFAETTPPAPNPNEGAFDKLSPGNQKIAQALFDAQQSGSASTTTQQSGSTSTTTEPLTLDDIAAMKQDGKGWGEVFKEMKAQGLLQDKNLGQVVSRANHLAHAKTSGGTMITTGSGRSYVAGARSKPGRGSASDQGAGGDSGQKYLSDHGPKTGGDHGRTTHMNPGRHGYLSGSGVDYSVGAGFAAGANAGHSGRSGHGGRGKN